MEWHHDKLIMAPIYANINHIIFPSFQKSFNKIFKADWIGSQRSVSFFFWIPFCYLMFVSPMRFVDQRKVSQK